MKYFSSFLLILYLITPFKTFSQDKVSGKIDSLNKALGGKIHDTVRIRTLIHLAGEHILFSPELAIKDCEASLALAKKINHPEGTGEALGWLAYLHEQQGNINKALDFYRQSLVIAEKTGDKKGQAAIYNNIAAIFKDQGLISEALSYHSKSLALRKELGDKEGTATSYNNIGLIYSSQGRIPNALDFLIHSLQIYEELKNNDGISTALQNIGAVYREQHEHEKAFEYFRRALAIEKEQGNKYGMGYALNLLGGLHDDLGNLDSALRYFNESFQLRTEIDDKQGVAYSLKNSGIVYKKMGRHHDAENSFRRSLKKFEELGDKMGIAISTNLLGGVLLESRNTVEAQKYLDRSLSLAQELGYPANISAAAENLQRLYRTKNAWKEALLMNDIYIRMRDSVQNDINRKAAVKTQFKYEYEKKEAILKSEQEKKDAVAKAEISKQKLLRNTVFGGFAIVLIFAGVFFTQRNRISKEKKRSDELLLNILPEEVAEELKAKGSADAKQFDDVTVMFTDFKGFTQISEKLSPAALVSEIDTCFKAFDNIISKHNIEKIKTIGDAYMCAGGLPVANKSHAEDVVNAAIEIQQFMQQHLQQRKNEGKEVFEIRIGIHTGPVVAGIVGMKKFAYDIWGDTVNIASRMESSGEAGKVNISGNTYELAKDKFACIHRGKIMAKNKGEIDMYFVNGKI